MSTAVLYDIHGNLPALEAVLMETNYNFEQAAERVRKTSYPQAEHFAANSILNPPSEAKMLEVFSRSELKK